MDIRIELRDRELREALSRLVTAGADMSPATPAISLLHDSGKSSGIDDPARPETVSGQ